MKRKMLGARYIAESFKGYGVTHVFYLDAILRRTLVEMETLGIRRILAHSEKAAAYMADGYARVTRRAGICMAQNVGAANLAAGLQDAFLGFSPVIAITGRKPPLTHYRHAYQEILHNTMFEPVTKYNVCVDTIEQLPYLLRQAFREATSGTPGPVHLDLLGYSGELIDTGTADLEVMIEERFKQVPSSRPEPEADLVKKAAEILMNAKRPVIVAGGGARASSAGPEIKKLAEMLSIPVATSLNAKGIILEDHPLNVGIVGAYSRWCTNQIVSEADLVLYVGSSTGDQVSNGWTVPPSGTPVIQIDINPVELGRSYPNVVGLMGDAKVTVSRLIDSIRPREGGTKWTEHAQQIVRKWRNEVKPLHDSDSVPILQERLCKEITEVLPRDGILVADTGFAGIWAGTMIDLKQSEQTYVRAAGSLGWGFPASLGAKCGAPERPVICFTGDGGFWYHLSELETAARYGINTVTVVNNNHGFAQCLIGINRAYGERTGNKEELFKFSPKVSFAKIAQDIGCMGISVERPEEIRGALQKALVAEGPVVVEVHTDPTHMAPLTGVKV
jgi:acetolactate synthase-1/2/3 large subunit